MTPTGIEPVLPPWKGDVLTAWPWSQIQTPQVGLEPTTLRLTAECSTDWAIEDYLCQIDKPRRTKELAECSTDWAIEDYFLKVFLYPQNLIQNTIF